MYAIPWKQALSHCYTFFSLNFNLSIKKKFYKCAKAHFSAKPSLQAGPPPSSSAHRRLDRRSDEAGILPIAARVESFWLRAARRLLHPAFTWAAVGLMAYKCIAMTVLVAERGLTALWKGGTTARASRTACSPATAPLRTATPVIQRMRPKPGVLHRTPHTAPCALPPARILRTLPLVAPGHCRGHWAQPLSTAAVPPRESCLACAASQRAAKAGTTAGTVPSPSYCWTCGCRSPPPYPHLNGRSERGVHFHFCIVVFEQGPRV